MKPAEAVPKFLRSIGRGFEAGFYLDLFRAEAKESFAAIALESSTLREEPDAVVMDLRFLSVLGLTPVVVLGLEDQPGCGADADKLGQQLQGVKVAAATVAGGADGARIAAVARSGALPLVFIEKPDPERRLIELGQMLSALKTRKLIFLQEVGGLRRGGRLVSLVNLSSEYESLLGCQDLSERQKELLSWSRRLIFELVSHQLLVAITSPLDLLNELFTLKGAGTLLRRGARIDVYRGLDELDINRLRKLLAASFRRRPVEEFFARPLSRAYLEENYQGAALMMDTPLGGYLTKFAVTRQAQGEGMGHDLWQRVVDDYPRLFWRARPENPIAPWYEKQCDGRVKAGPWIVYFRGLQIDHIAQAVQFAVNQPSDFLG